MAASGGTTGPAPPAVLPGKGMAAGGGPAAVPAAAGGDEAEGSAARPPSDEAEEGRCVQEIVHCLLDAKGGASSTPAVQVAINSSVIQVAKANFSLVVTSLFSFLEGRQSSEQHQLWLLRLLCQVLETRRSDGDVRKSVCMVDRAMARNLTHYLVREVAKLFPEDPRQSAISDVLVELAPMHPDIVLTGVLAMLDNCGAAASSAPLVLVSILTEIAYTAPHVLEGRIHEVMGRYLPLFQTSKTPDMKLLLFRAWSSLCVALVNCACRQPGEAICSTDSTFSHAFGASALDLRRRQAVLLPAPARSSSFSDSVCLPSSNSAALSTAFTALMSSWQSSKDPNLRIGAMDTLGHLCLVIPKDLFLTNADALLELVVNLVTRQSSSSPALPPFRLVRGLCLLLQSCLDADPEILLLENALQTLSSTMFAWTVGSGPLQYLQGRLGTESLQSQAEVLRCFEVLAESFQKQILSFLLQRVRGTRDDRLGALLILRHLIGSTAWRPRPATVVEGIQFLTGDTDPAVGLLLSELIVALAASDFLTAAKDHPAAAPPPDGVGAAGGSVGANGDSPRPEHVQALLHFVISQTAVAQSAEGEQPFYVAKLMSKSLPIDMPSFHEVRGRAGLVLWHLAGILKPSIRAALWPMLLQAALNPAMRPGLPVLCRAVAQIVAGARVGSGEAAHASLSELATAFQVGREGSTQPEALLMWLLICAHSPHEPPGLGINILRCLEALSPLLNRTLGEIWEAPSSRLQTLCAYLEENGVPNRLDGDFWTLALAQEVHFFLAALPEHDDLPAKFVDILGGLHLEIWRKDRDACDLSDLQRAALLNLTGVCLSHVGPKDKVSSTLDFLLSHSSDLITDPLVRRAYARGLGIVAQRHFELVLGVLGRAAKTDAATRRAGSIAQSFFGKSTAVQQAECLRAMLALALGYCAVYAPSPGALQEKLCEHILAPLAQALAQERTVLVLRSVVEAVKLASDATRMAPETLALGDPFLGTRDQQQECPEVPLSKEPSLTAALGLQRDALLRALLPFIETPGEQEDEQRLSMFEELVCPALNSISSLVALPFDLPSNLYASVLEDSLHVLIFSIPNDQVRPTSEELLKEVDPVLLARIQAVTSLVKSLLFHAHSWLGVSRLLQAVHAAGASCPVEFIRWTCTRLLGVLCKAAPILTVTKDLQDEEEDAHSDVGDWCECLALLLPRTGDSCKAIVPLALDALQQLLSRCEWTANVQFGALGEAALTTDEQALRKNSGHRSAQQHGEEGDPAPPSQQLVGVLVARLPPSAIPPLVQHLMPAMHDADSHAALSGVDALYLILQACCDKLSEERATNLVSTVFEEVEKVSHSSVRQKVLSCVKVLALHHFESAVSELLDTGPEFNTSILGALQVLAKEKALLLRLLNHFTDTLNNSDPGTVKRPNKLMLAATVALGHLFTVNDSSIGIVVKKYFPQLFGTFLLRIGTTMEGLCAQQTAMAFMNFLHASQNDSMAMALEGNRLFRVTRDLYDEVICELTALYCRHHPSKRALLLNFIHPFLSRPFPGHRVATITTLAQLLMCGTDGGAVNREFLSVVVDSLLQCVNDAHATVRKQSIRGMGHLVLLWQAGAAEGISAAEDAERCCILAAACRALADDAPVVQREAVVAVQRACQVESASAPWREVLLGTSCHLQNLVDAEDPALRGASLDLLGQLCSLWVEACAEPGTGQPEQLEAAAAGRAAHSPRAAATGDFGLNLELLLVSCVVRLEDTCGPVSAAASRCLRHLATARARGGSAAAAEAAELVERREREHMEFEQFVFPFMALAQEAQDLELAVQRLGICRRYLSGPRVEAPEPPGGLQRRMPTCAAAGFVAAALARCLAEVWPRPSELLCEVCRELMGLLAVEDSDFRAQVARILGFFDILSRPGAPA